jgi:hypothetical protein
VALKHECVLIFMEEYLSNNTELLLALENRIKLYFSISFPCSFTGSNSGSNYIDTNSSSKII